LIKNGKPEISHARWTGLGPNYFKERSDNLPVFFCFLVSPL